MAQQVLQPAEKMGTGFGKWFPGANTSNPGPVQFAGSVLFLRQDIF